MRSLLFILVVVLLGSCSPQLNNRSYHVGKSGVYWEQNKYDGAQRKKLKYYRMGWGVANCPVYNNGPVRRDVMRRYHYYRHQ